MRWFGLVFVAVLFLAAVAAPCRAAGGKVVLLVVDCLDMRDVVAGQDLVNLRQLLGTGAVGAMNISTGGARNSPNAHVTLGAGCRAVGSEESAGMCLGVDEDFRGVKGGTLYRQLTGRRPQGAVVCPMVSLLAVENSRLPQVVRPGLLGGLLQEAGVRTAVVGNADTPSAPRRYAAVIAMDTQGQVAWGCVGREILRRDEGFPFFLRTDEGRLQEEFARALAQADFIVVDWGDVSRLEAYGSAVDSAVLCRYRCDALRRFDTFLTAVVQRLDLSRDLLIVVSPCVSAASASRGELLAPVVAAGAGISPGLLTSDSTRRPGLVTSVDIAPTVLARFGLPRVYPMVGEPIRSVGSPHPLRTVHNLSRRAATAFAARPIFVRTYVFLELSAVAAALLAGLGFLHGVSQVRLFLLVVSAAPLAFLLLPLAGQVQPAAYVPAGWAGAFALAIGMLCLWRGDWEATFGSVALATVAGIMVDTLAGGALAVASPLGHCLVGGARFYGVGNEHGGIVLGAVLAAATLAVDRWGLSGRRAAMWLAPLFGLVSLATVSPSVGANAGAGAAALVGLGTSIVALCRGRVRWRDRVLLVVLALLVVGGTAMLNMAGGRETLTHMGRALEALKYGGVAELSVLVRRKLGMNVKLLRYTIWSRAFAVLLLVMALSLWWRGGVRRKALEKRPVVLAGMVGALAASAVGFVANDSGVVMAATTLVHPVGLLLGMAAGESRPGQAMGPGRDSAGASGVKNCDFRRGREENKGRAANIRGRG